MRRFSFIFILAFGLLVHGNLSAEPEAAVETTLYFGLDLPDGSKVDESEWVRFLADAITPRFPDGFTVIDAYGQWRNPELADAPVVREATKIIVIVHPETREAETSIAEIKSLYMKLFAQKSVFHTEAPVRVRE